MDSKELMWLENAAIRYVTSMNYKTNEQIISTGLIVDGTPLVMDDLKLLSKDLDSVKVSDRSKEVIREVIRNEDKVKLEVEKYVWMIEQYGIKLIPRTHRDYPYSWKKLSGMPPLIFARGDTSILSSISVNGAAAIVGSRDASRYALYATGQFSAKLAGKGVVIVSGLALGTDRKAHEACIEEGGKTVAITAGGSDVVYPYQNKDLYERITENGVLITELPPGQEVMKQYFPSRNRLISALSDVCLIMEAGMYSGTLHTASFAGNQGKDVFVLPNSIYSDNSLGGLLLLRDGAEVLIDVQSVYERILQVVDSRRADLEDMNSEAGTGITELRCRVKNDPESLSEDDWKAVVCDEISERPKNIDDLCISLGIPISYLSSLVTMLETEGRIANEKGKYVLTIRKG
ncbi:MAG: DNA-processing protein DprA [Clostridiales bacterium]|nr:DNA-processing protein DprA [Clostridiales bacterium]